jgi:hypothetical protein
MPELKDTAKFIGSVNIKMFDENGKLIYEQTNSNLEVTVGKVFLAAWLAASTQSTPFMSYVGLGTGSTAPTIGDTNLQTPLPTRVQGTLTSSSTVWQNVATFGPGVDTGAITEAGLFSASSGGTMFARQVFSVVNKGAGNTLIVTWQVSIL